MYLMLMLDEQDLCRDRTGSDYSNGKSRQFVEPENTDETLEMTVPLVKYGLPALRSPLLSILIHFYDFHQFFFSVSCSSTFSMILQVAREIRKWGKKRGFLYTS